MKYFAIALASAALTGAQTPAISIKPNMAVSPSATNLAVAKNVAIAHLGAPILGYVAGPAPLDLHAIVGTPKGAQQGASVALPNDVKRLFLPPREHYLLLENKNADPLAVFVPFNGAAEASPLTGAMAHPDAIAFSARGDAALLYAKSADHLQVVIGLPAEPVLATVPGIAKWGEASSFAVSDDGQMIVAALADGTAVSLSRGATDWQRLPLAYNASAILFVPRTHNVVVSDAAQETLTLVSNLAEHSQATRTLAHNVSADRLAFNKEGSILLAASSTQSKVWTVDLKTMTPGPVSFSSIDTLLTLRDGHTFLLSTPNLALLNIPVESDSITSFVPVTR